MTLYANWQNGAPPIDSESIDWSKVNRRSFRYKLVQKPGPQNALGRLKFMFPNKFSVYLHDTPSKELFQKNIRSFSSGCIRAEKPVELAVYLLKDSSNWTKEKIMAAITHGKNRSIGIPKPLNVHLLYWTAWVDKAGEIHFRDDIYDRDRPLDKALKERPPRV
jgi:murein L,D-transpeptidase YcbB/YkuD